MSIEIDGMRVKPQDREIVWAQDLLRGVRVSCTNDEDINMPCQPSKKYGLVDR